MDSVVDTRAAEQDLAQMPNLRRLAEAGDRAALVPSFACVTCPVQANMTTGQPPSVHGVIANGFYYRERREIEMWTAWNECIQSPQIWDILHEKRPGTTSAVWFALHSKGSGADFVCTPAPIHNPDGSESLWCYTKPTELYGELMQQFDHFPLQHFWGPLANIHSTAWIADSAIDGARRYRPHFFYIYLPHLDYAAQKDGPDSEATQVSVSQLDEVLGKLFAGINDALVPAQPLWIVASEYTIQPVDHVSYPNRVLREAGLLEVREEQGGEVLDLDRSRVWTLADHQLGHVFVQDADPQTIETVCQLFAGHPGVAEVLAGDQRAKYDLVHPRSGEVVLVSNPNSWQAYYYWLDNARAPAFARTVDIHRKPGYDPVELFLDQSTWSIPLDATLVKGSHGAPPYDDSQRGVILASEPGVFALHAVADTDVAELILHQFGI